MNIDKHVKNKKNPVVDLFPTTKHTHFFIHYIHLSHRWFHDEEGKKWGKNGNFIVEII